MRRELLCVLALVCAPLAARDAADPYADPYQEASEDVAFEIPEANNDAWNRFGEFSLRGDRVSGLPGGREDLERARARARVGVRWEPEGAFAVGFAAVAALGSDENRDNLINNDVSKSNGVGLDQAWVRWRFGDEDGVQLGKAAIPLSLTPMTWDDDLRPVGLSLHSSGTVRDFDRWQFDFGVFAPDPLQHDGSRLTAAQFAWHWREGAPFSAGAIVGWLDWSDTATLARAGLGRGNSLVAGRYRHDYRLLDLQAYARWRVGQRPLEFRLNRVTNLDADEDDDGTRASLVYGDRLREPGWEFGWAWERIQRDAVLAAVNSDDWWFHTAMRGHMPWFGYGFDGGTWSVRVAAFFETRDGLQERTERLLLDIDARW